MNIHEQLEHSQSINPNLGLKYLNNNETLYLKVLKSFLMRYESLEIKQLSEEELKTTMHSLKGLSATLGMERLSLLAEELHKKSDENTMNLFMEQLNDIRKEIKHLE